MIDERPFSEADETVESDNVAAGLPVKETPMHRIFRIEGHLWSIEVSYPVYPG